MQGELTAQVREDLAARASSMLAINEGLVVELVGTRTAAPSAVR